MNLVAPRHDPTELSERQALFLCLHVASRFVTPTVENCGSAVHLGEPLAVWAGSPTFVNAFPAAIRPAMKLRLLYEPRESIFDVAKIS
jgi:hypothetical protein